jgi:hypothetical protein
MGCRFRFSCPACGFSAEVSGGADGGFVHITTTIVCDDCKTLHDITTEYVDGSEESKLWKKPVFRCPRSAKHGIREWKDGDPCPKCGGKMENEGATTLWD